MKKIVTIVCAILFFISSCSTTKTSHCVKDDSKCAHKVETTKDKCCSKK